MNNNIIQKIIEQTLEDKDVFFPFVSHLNKQEEAVLKLRKQGLSLNVIGKKIGNLTRQRVQQIEDKAGFKIELKEKIIKNLAQELGEVLFTDREIERKFFDWSAMEDNGLLFSERKARAYDFVKYIWEDKQRPEENNNKEYENKT